MTKKLMSRRAFTPTIKYIKINDIASNAKYEISLDEAREIVSERHINGLVECGRQIGKRFFIDQEKFEKWLENYKAI